MEILVGNSKISSNYHYKIKKTEILRGLENTLYEEWCKEQLHKGLF